MSEYIGMYKQQKELIQFYGKKLGIDKELITDVYFPSIDQVDQILKDKVEPHVKAWDEEGVKLVDGKAVFPKYVEEAYNIIVKDKKGPRLYEALLPEEFDGVGFPGLVLSAVMELMAYYDMSLSSTIGLATTLIEAIALHPTDFLTQTYYPKLQEGVGGFVAFTEPQAGSNLRNINTTSVLEGDNYIVKGTKIFITNAGFAEIGIVLAKNIVNGKEEGTNALMIDASTMKDVDDSSKSGVICTRLEEKLGIHASATGVLDFNCVVPRENLLGKPGKGYRTTLERLLGMRMGVAGQATALAERAYQLAKSYAHERIQFGKPIVTFAAIENKLRGMERELLKMRKFTFESSYVLSRHQMGLPIKTKYLKLNEGEESTLREFSSQYNRAVLNHTISKAKMYNTEIGWYIVDDALQIFGGNGYIREYHVERLLRDFRVLRIYEGTSEIHEVVINRTKNVATADSLNTLMEVALADKGASAYAPDRVPIDYQEIFLRRFGSTMNSFIDDEGEPIFLFDD